MAGRDNYMYWSTGSRFQPFGLTHNPIMGNSMMAQHMMNSSMYKNIHSLKTEMPSDVLELFKANEIGYVRPIRRRKCRSLDPVTSAKFNIVAMFPDFEEYVEKPEIETRQMKLEKKLQQRTEQAKAELQDKIQHWNPFEESLASSDPYKTLIVARLKYETTEKTIRSEFEKYGVVKSVKLVTDKEGKSRGYAFVEFQRRQDFLNAYKNAHLRRIDGRRVIVDFEKGRTILQWRPRRLGGGEGTLRLTRQQVQAREKAKNLVNEQKQARRKEKNQQRREQKEQKHRQHSRSRSRERKERRKERERQREKERQKPQHENDRDRNRDRNYDRERQREVDRDRGRDRDRQRDRERERDRERHQIPKDSQRDRHERKGKTDMDIEAGGKDKKDKKEKKEKSRDRSHRKDKKEKKEKKERKEYVAMNVPVDEFR